MVARRILIRVDGDASLGLGHVVRMRALGLALGAEGLAPVVAVRDGTVGADLLREAGLELFAVNDPSCPYEFARAAVAAGTGMVVIDKLDTEPVTIEMLRAAGIDRIASFDDTGAGLRSADLVVNPIVFHWGRYRPQDVRAVLAEGPGYIILSPEIARAAAIPPSPKPAGAVAPRLLAAFGGTDNRNLSELFAQMLRLLPVPVEARINLGPGAVATAGLAEALSGSPHPVMLLQGVPSLAAEMRAADLVVCAGGVMLYELAALGIPAAAVASEEHELRNIRYFARQGTAIDLGFHADLSPRGLAQRLEALLEDTMTLRRMRAAGPTLVDGRGLERCVGLLKELAA